MPRAARNDRPVRTGLTRSPALRSTAFAFALVIVLARAARPASGGGTAGAEPVPAAGVAGAIPTVTLPTASPSLGTPTLVEPVCIGRTFCEPAYAEAARVDPTRLEPGSVEPAAVAQGQAARLEVRAGSLRIENAAGSQQRGPREGALELHGGARLVLGSGVRASVTWPGIASAELVGPLELAWSAPNRADAAPALDLLALGGRLELEWRSAAGSLKLAQGYELSARRCALELLGRPGGALELVHRGGEDLGLRSLAERTPGTWPSRLRAGASARLLPPERPR